MNNRAKLLYVEDDLRTAELVREYLESENFEVVLESDGITALRRIQAERFDCVLLDITLPNLGGLEICRAIRPRFRGAIMMVTARGEANDQVIGLDSGADDYLPKPIQPKLLRARLNALVRRFRMNDGSEGLRDISFGDVEICLNNRTLKISNQEIPLTSTEFDVFWMLAQHRDAVVTRSDLHMKVRGVRYDGLDRSIDLMIGRIRKKIGDNGRDPRIIKSIHGTGYLLVTQ